MFYTSSKVEMVQCIPSSLTLHSNWSVPPAKWRTLTKTDTPRTAPPKRDAVHATHRRPSFSQPTMTNQHLWSTLWLRCTKQVFNVRGKFLKSGKLFQPFCLEHNFAADHLPTMDTNIKVNKNDPCYTVPTLPYCSADIVNTGEGFDERCL